MAYYHLFRLENIPLKYMCLASPIRYESVAQFTILNQPLARYLMLFFAACFWSMQLCHANYSEPSLPHNPTFYASELAVAPEGQALFEKINSLFKPENVGQSATEQPWHAARSIAQYWQYLLTDLQLHTLLHHLTTQLQYISFVAQQQVLLDIPKSPNMQPRLFQPELDPYPSFLFDI